VNGFNLKTESGNVQEIGVPGSEIPASISFSDLGSASTTNINSGKTASSNTHSQAMITNTSGADQGLISPVAGLKYSITANTAKTTSSSIIKTTTMLASSTSTTMSTTTRSPCLAHECKLNVINSYQ